MTQDQASSSAPQDAETDSKQDAETQAPVNSETPVPVNLPLNGELLPPQPPGNALIPDSPLQQDLAAATTTLEIKTVHDKSATLRDHARRAKDRALFDEATEVMLEAQRLIGQQLIDMAARGERTLGHAPMKKVEFPEGTPLSLADLGITKKQSSNWQWLARMSEKEFKALAKDRKTRVAVVMGVEEVQFPRRTAAKAHARPEKTASKVDNASGVKGDADGTTTKDEATNETVADQTEGRTPQTSNAKTQTKTVSGARSRSNGSLRPSALQFKDFQAQLRSVTTRLLATIDDPPPDLMAHLKKCAFEIAGLVERGYTH
jgi:hypothetical protein